MSRKTAIIVLITIAAALGLVALISFIPLTNIDPEAMPELTAQYVDQRDIETQVNLNCSAYHWKVKDPTSEEIVWLDADPENIFHLKYATKEILPGDLEINLQLVWLEPPQNIIIKRWPLSEWRPADFEATHSQGEDVEKSWETHWKKTNLDFDVERGTLYGIWVYYGEEWVQYSFIVPAEDPIDYDYLGYISGFDESSATQFELDPIEWIDMSNTQRIGELNLNVDDDFPSGFYIYNPTKESIELRLTDQTKYSIIDPETGNTQKTVNKSEFFNHLSQFGSFSEAVPYWISETDGNVVVVMEQYLP